MSPNDFYSTLAEELIDNKYMMPRLRSTCTPQVTNDACASGIGPHLTMTCRKRKRADGTVSNALYQGRCRICRNGSKSKYVCSECTRTNLENFWVLSQLYRPRLLS